MNEERTNNTFKGLEPYIEKDAARFKGRSKESQDLFRLITQNEYSICYGESGEGKSSLLNAGVFPLLREHLYFPIKIVFNSDTDYSETPKSFDHIMERCIADCIAEYNKEHSKKSEKNVIYGLYSDDFVGMEQCEQLKAALQKDSWWMFRNYRPQAFGLALTPVFIFDQFEEVFNRPKSELWTKHFFDWLQKISTDSCPDYLITRIRSIIGKDAAFPKLKKEKDFKIVFSLRREFMAELDYWSMQQHFIPAMKEGRYYLKPLTFEGAKSVMRQLKDLDEDTIDNVLNYLMQKYGKDASGIIKEKLPAISALELSVICDDLNRNYNKYSDLIRKNAAQCVNKIQSYFYDRTINSVLKDSTKQKIKARKEELEEVIFELLDANGNRERKKSMSKTLEELHFNERYKKSLCEHRLIKIDKIGNEEYVEIVHDSLCPVIKKRKEKIHKDKERARIIAEKAKRLISEGDSYLAQLLALRILPTPIRQDYPYTIEGENLLREVSRQNNAIMRGHNMLAFYVAYSSDGSRILSTSFCQMCIWDSSNGKLLNVLSPQGNDNLIRYASFNSDGTRIVPVSDDGYVRILDVKSNVLSLIYSKENEYQENREGTTFIKLKVPFSSIRFTTFVNHDKQILFITAEGDICITSSEIKGESMCYNLIYTLPVNVKSASISSNEKFVAIVSSDDDTIIRIWDMSDMSNFKRLPDLKGHTAIVRSLSFHPNEKVLLSVSDDQTIRIWDLDTAKCKVLYGHTGAVFCASYSSDGKYIVSSSADKDIIVWDVTVNFSKRILKGHSNCVRFVTFHPKNNNQIVSVSDDTTVRIWENPFIREEEKPMHENLDGACVPKNRKDDIEIDRRNYLECISPNGKYKAYSSDTTIQIKDITELKKPKLLGKWKEDKDIKEISFDHHEKYIMLVSDRIRILTINGKLYASPKGYYGGNIEKASFSHDDKMIVYVNERTISLWHIETDVVKSMRGYHEGRISAVSFSSDDSKIVSASSDGTIKIWDVETGMLLDTIENGNDDERSIVSMSAEANNSYLISSESSNSVKKIWKYPSLQELIDQTYERFKDRELTLEEKAKYYLD